jgi:hypoxanthine phosphoribosyltransferase
MAIPAVRQIISEEEIRRRVAELAAQIQTDLSSPLSVIVVLKGAFMFAADLVRHLEGDIFLDFATMSSYRGQSTSPGGLQLLKDVDLPILGHDVLIIEDIVDTGHTLSYLQDRFRTRGSRLLRTACLLSKPHRRQVDVTLDYVGFTIDDLFVVGYGLDYDGRYRHLPYIATLGE